MVQIDSRFRHRQFPECVFIMGSCEAPLHKLREVATVGAVRVIRTASFLSNRPAAVLHLEIRGRNTLAPLNSTASTLAAAQRAVLRRFDRDTIPPHARTGNRGRTRDSS